MTPVRVEDARMLRCDAMLAVRNSARTSPPWTHRDLLDLGGATVVVTGANSGLGLATTLALARRGATVVMGCRSPSRAAAAVERVRAEVPHAELELRGLDLADLASVRRFADEVADAHGHLDVLCNNAGVMAVPFGQTRDGFELQFGTNHLGHFALTGRLMPLLLARRGARVVTVSSHMHRPGRIDFEDLGAAKRYSKWGAYARSKLANLSFALELHRRLVARRRAVASIAAHPGYAATELQAKGPRMAAAHRVARFFEFANDLVAQPAEMGAWPQLYAIAAPQARSGAYYGPAGWLEMRGPPREVEPSPRAADPELGRRLWAASERLTGVHFDMLG